MLLIFDSHPVQYKAPIYQRLAQLRPGSFRVIYATDVTLRGHRDREFDAPIAWDTPLLEGYDHLVLHNERGTPLQGFRSLTGRGVFDLLRRERPAAVLISQFLYAFDLAAYLGCRRLGVPIWIRHETQDEAFIRPAWKSALRGASYRLAYRGVAHAFAIGELNREHLLRHGVPTEHITYARYAVPEPAASGRELRDATRERFHVESDETLLVFSGKFIDKKNPALLLDAFRLLAADKQPRFRFINQSEIPSYYAAADILILPSRRAGETWGLVVNEALQAGCGVVMTDAVGCHREFGRWDRVRVIPVGDAAACAHAVRELARFPRASDWCVEAMQPYSIDAAAQAIAARIDLLTT
jgi:glycosyltransferase involved in cell wall biosynthesis